MRSTTWLTPRAGRACAAILFGSLCACGSGADGAVTSDGTSSDANPSMTGESTGGANGNTSGVSPSGNTGTVVSGDDAGVNQPARDDDTFYRADTLKLIKPRLVTKPRGTTNPFLQPDITGQAQSAVNDGLVLDKEPDPGDGYVDLNAMIRFTGKVDPSQPGGIVTAGAGLCPYPYDQSKPCGPLKLGPFQDPASYTNGQDCMLDGSVEVASGSCFSSEKGAFTVNIQLIGPVQLQETQVIGGWVDGGAGGINQGWIRGFLSEETAKNTRIPKELPLAAIALGIMGNAPVSDFLADADKQASPPGWWFTLKYTAKPAIYDETVGPDGVK